MVVIKGMVLVGTVLEAILEAAGKKLGAVPYPKP